MFEDKSIDTSVHGYSGPAKVSMGSYAPSLRNVQDDVIAAAASVGIPATEDLMDLKIANAIAVCVFSRIPLQPG